MRDDVQFVVVEKGGCSCGEGFEAGWHSLDLQQVVSLPFSSSWLIDFQTKLKVYPWFGLFCCY